MEARQRKAQKVRNKSQSCTAQLRHEDDVITKAITKVIGSRADMFCNGAGGRSMQGVPYIQAPRGSTPPLSYKVGRPWGVQVTRSVAVAWLSILQCFNVIEIRVGNDEVESLWLRIRGWSTKRTSC